MSTTQILFNSPALHSLKREQLMKLCKIHSLKANGKNVELIQRLRQHAQTLPKDSPLSIAARSEEVASIQSTEMNDEIEVHKEQDDLIEEEQDHSDNRRVRPSEQWEVVMDSIEEAEENSSQGTMSSQRTINCGTGEFGTGASKASTVGSSIRAFASSLGLKRTTSKPSTASSKASATGHSQPDMFIASDELAQNSVPYSALPPPASLPQTDHFTLDTGRPSLGLANPDESPLPGHVLRPGIPVPPNARLSLGLGLGVPATPTRQGQPTTTIRLVSNPLAVQNESTVSYAGGEHRTPQLKPLQTTFDITFGSPAQGDPFNFGLGSLNSWPPRADREDAEMSGLYPKLTTDDLAPSVVVSPRQATKTDDDIQMPGSLNPIHDAKLKAPGSPTPFIFGSPNHRVSNHQFRDAAASVLEEMNARLRADGVDEISIDIVNKLHPDRKAIPSEQREIKPLPASKRGEITSKFDVAHDREFSKMEGINDTFKKRQQRHTELSPDEKDGGNKKEEKKGAVIKRKSSFLESNERPKRPSAFGSKSRTSTTRVISTGRRAKVIPGGFVLDDDDDDETADNSRQDKRIRADSESPTPEELKMQEERQIELEREKEAIRKKLEVNRARRRSSAAAAGRKSIGGAGGRMSIGRNGPRKSVLIKPKPKPSRFGFLASAKSLVQSVWSRGKNPAAAPPSNIPKPASTKVEAVPVTKEDKDRGKLVPPAFVPNKKSALAPAKPTTTNVSGDNNTRMPSTRLSTVKQVLAPTSQAPKVGSIASSHSSRSRSPLPSFEDASTLTSNSSSGIGSGLNTLQSTAGRVSFVHGTGKSRSSASAVSSIGTRLGGGSSSNGGTVNSMGSRQTSGGTSRTSRTAGSSSSSTKQLTRLSSRLFAPTASSLAKAAHRTSTSSGMFAPSSSSVVVDAKPAEYASQDKEKQLEKPTLCSITNSPALHRETGSTISPGIPLMLPRSRIPSPVKKGLPSNAVEENLSSNASKASIQVKRTASGRKPRISRSKVIARLASQRSASGSSTASSHTSSSNSSVLKPRSSGSARSGRTRSSLGVQVSRASYGGAAGIKGRGSGSNAFALAMSAKKRARQSEYSRRRSSKVVNIPGSSSVDDEAGKECSMAVDGNT